MEDYTSNDIYEPIKCVPIDEYINNNDIVSRDEEPIKCNC